MRELSGSVAVITGGGAGIGLAMAARFGREGARLVIADIQQDAIDHAVAGLSEAGFEAVGVRADVSRYEDVQSVAESALRAFGKVHIVANNAGVSMTGPTWKMSLDDWRWVHGVNLWGVIHGIKAFVPILLAQGEPGHVINTASLASFNGIGEHAPYCSSKAACLSISQALRSELIAANTQIGVSVVCPGMVATDIHRSWRNRPPDDRPWSDREQSDPAHMARSDAFQGSGVAPERIADATLEAVLNDRFYVYYGMEAGSVLARSLRPALRAENPPVVTWGPDLRPASRRRRPRPGRAG